MRTTKPMPSPKITMACSGLVAYIDPPKGYRVVEAMVNGKDGDALPNGVNGAHAYQFNWARISFERVPE